MLTENPIKYRFKKVNFIELTLYVSILNIILILYLCISGTYYLKGENNMFGLFKSWNEKCLVAAKRLYGGNDNALEEWFDAFSSEMTEIHEDGQKQPEFCVAWSATRHLHKIVKAQNPQDKFLGSRCKVKTNNAQINKVTIKICEAASKNMGDEMRAGVLSSLNMIK